MTMECHEVRRLIPFYVDNELSQEDMRSIEVHVSKCESCAVFLREEMEMKEALASLGHVVVPTSLEDSIIEAINKEEKKTVWKKVSVAISVLAITGLAFMWGLNKGKESSIKLSPSLMENLVVEHECPAPLDKIQVKDPKSLSEIYGKQTGLYVEPFVPVSWGNLEGARVTRFQGRRAVQFAYKYKGRRVTLLVFDPSLMDTIPILSNMKKLKLSPSHYITKTPGGRHVVLFKHGNLGYSIISDLDEKDTIEFVSHIIKY